MASLGVGALSDNELQRKLLEYQRDVPPITNSTRKVLERKLRRYESNNRSSLGFSSDESDDSNTPVETRRSSRRLSARLSTPACPTPPHRPPSFIRPTAASGKRPNNNSGRHSLSPAGSFSPSRAHDTLDDSDDERSSAKLDVLRRRVVASNSKPLTEPECPKSNGHGQYPSESLLDAQFTTAEDLASHNGNGSQCVSMILVAVLAIFFAAIGSIYLGLLHKDSKELLAQPTVSGDRTKGTVVAAANPGVRFTPFETAFSGVTGSPSQFPLQEDDHLNVLKAVEAVRRLLRQRAGDYECDWNRGYAGPGMTSNEAMRATYPELESLNVPLSRVIQLLEDNPKWGVRVYSEGGQTYLEAGGRYHVSLACRLRNFLRDAFYAYFHLILGACCLGFVTCCLYSWSARRKRERDLVFSFVERILDVLRQHHEASVTRPDLKPFVAIPHVRDMLIGPVDRKKYKDAWEKAVRFIEGHESRVRLESQIVEGEEFQVWRWVQPPAASEGSGTKKKKEKVWQGQAFENPDGGMNSLPCSPPTACLKIRSMFDLEVEYGDNWSGTIRDAILDKCGDGKIVHLRVDTASKEGCVYLKCVDSEAAGAAYRALHGWWFDGKLVTVKYLRLERYHARFPEAANCCAPMKGSGL